MTLPFHKYQGLGNDFILFEVLEDLDPTLARSLCDRHFGIGADGILLLSPALGFDAKMVVINPDGTRPEMCGNGLRCAALHLASKLDSDLATIVVNVLTDAGPKTCSVELQVGAPSCPVTVNMGPATHRGNTTIRLRDRDLTVHLADLGNPHGIVFEALSDDDFSLLGPALATHPSFPEGLNASFVHELAPGHLAVRVWERGVGPTLACGTAACAVAAVAHHDPTNRTTTNTVVHLPGGQLTVELTPSGALLMTGPASLVFRGQLPHHEPLGTLL